MFVGRSVVRLQKKSSLCFRFCGFLGTKCKPVNTPSYKRILRSPKVFSFMTLRY